MNFVKPKNPRIRGAGQELVRVRCLDSWQLAFSPVDFLQVAAPSGHFYSVMPLVRRR